MSASVQARAARMARRSVAVLAVPSGVLVGITAMLIVAAATANRTISTAVAATLLLAASGSLGWWALRGLRLRLGFTIGVAAVALVLLAAVVGPLLYAPAPPATPYPASPQIQYWDLSTGSRIAYTRTAAREPRPTPVILVHGGPGAPDRPSPEPADALAAAGFDVYAYHQLGSGLSSRLADPSGYTVTRHVADLDAIRETLRADRIVLIGASWGAQLIANYLATHPDRVEKAVVTSPGTIWSPAFTDDERLTAAGRQDQSEVIGQQPRFMFAHMLMHTIGPRAANALLPDSIMDGVYEAVVASLDMGPGCAGPGEDAGTPAGFGFWVNAATGLDSQRIADPRPRLRQVTAPVLVLRGECDYLAWPVAREYRDLLPRAVLVPVDGAGHTLAEDQPKLFRESVLAFLLDEPLSLAPYQGHDAPW